MIIRNLFLVLVALLTISAPAAAQKPIDDVVITGEVTNVTLCNRQGDAWTYKITVKLQARNAGVEPVIISTADAKTDFYKIANTLEDLQAKGYAHIGWVSSGPGDPKSVPSLQ
jgi:biopolymer transport protein ExbD